MSRQILSTLIGKTVKQAARLRGGGSALPGLVIEKIDPGFIARTLAQIPHGVVVISLRAVWAVGSIVVWALLPVTPVIGIILWQMRVLA